MRTDSESTAVMQQQLTALRIVWGGLLGGCVMVGAIMTFLRLQQGALFRADPWEFEILVVFNLAAVVLVTLLHWILPPLLPIPAVQAGRTWGDAETIARWNALDPGARQRMAHHQTATIVAMALLEGGAFLSFVLFFIQGSGWSLAAGLVCLALLALRFPTEAAYDSAVAEPEDPFARPIREHNRV